MAIKILTINKEADIIHGYLKGHRGKVIGYDATEGEVMIQLDHITTVIIDAEHVSQDTPVRYYGD